jgi:hypothetical protein
VAIHQPPPDLAADQLHPLVGMDEQVCNGLKFECFHRLPPVVLMDNA